jgi:hypothetical protein
MDLWDRAVVDLLRRLSFQSEKLYDVSILLFSPYWRSGWGSLYSNGSSSNAAKIKMLSIGTSTALIMSSHRLIQWKLSNSHRIIEGLKTVFLTPPRRKQSIAKKIANYVKNLHTPSWLGIYTMGKKDSSDATESELSDQRVLSLWLQFLEYVWTEQLTQGTSTLGK